MAASKRQTTMAKIARERAVLDKRARKAERKEERKRAAAEQAEHGEYGESGELDTALEASETPAETPAA